MKRARDPVALRDALAARAFSLQELATLAGCSKGTVSAVLAGKTLNRNLARRFAVVLRRPVDELFAVVESSDRQSDDQQDAVA